MSHRRSYDDTGKQLSAQSAGATGGRDLDETDPTPPEYELFKQWFWGDARRSLEDFQKLYRAFQAGYEFGGGRGYELHERL